MRSFLLAVGCLLSLVAGLTAAQRITGDQSEQSRGLVLVVCPHNCSHDLTTLMSAPPPLLLAVHLVARLRLCLLQPVPGRHP